MARKPITESTSLKSCTIDVRFPQEEYPKILQHPQLFRQHLDRWVPDWALAEALETEPDSKPATVNTDGWKGTHQAWYTLFRAIVLIRCFLHAWLKIRERGKHLKEPFFDIGKRVWKVYRCVWCPQTKKLNDGYRCPPEQLNKKRYADNRLQKLFIATSNTKK